MFKLSYLMLGELDNRVAYYINRGERISQLLQPQDVITTTIEEVSSSGRPLIQKMQKIPKTLKKLIDRLPHQEACHFLLPLFLMKTKYSYHDYLLKIGFYVMFKVCISPSFHRLMKRKLHCLICYGYCWPV